MLLLNLNCLETDAIHKNYYKIIIQTVTTDALIPLFMACSERSLAE